MNQKSLNEIIHSIINNIHDTLPSADTKEGTFVRDVFINPISNEFANIYGDIKLIELSQSVLTATGEDLDKLASNYFITRKKATKSYGKLRFYISENNFPTEITISKDTIVSSIATSSKDSVRVKTLNTEIITANRLATLTVASNGYKYIDIDAVSIDSGEFTNVNANELTVQENGYSQSIVQVVNPFAFSGGTDKESDNSLILRIKLALSGSNIGTKNGYLGYVLKQSGVIDAKIVGAGDPMMTRDDGYGGKVDIYIRGGLSQETTQAHKVDQTYINNDYPSIKLKKQPVNSIVSIIADDGTTFISANDFETTKETTVQSNGETKVNPTFYKDYEWDFSLTDSFPETEKFSLPDHLTDFQIKDLKNKVDAELKEALNYMTNINPDLNWNIMTKISENSLFYLWGSNNRVYRLIAYHPWISGIMFVKKNNTIYLRERGEPDYMLRKDIGIESDSTLASDSVQWLTNGKKPSVGQTLEITYNYDKLIDDIQTGIEDYRILTADVLIRKAQSVEVEISLDIQVYNDYSLEDTKTSVINKISVYINNLKTLGAEFDRSDIVSVAKEIEAVDRIDLDSVVIRKIGGTAENVIKINDNEYFEINNIIVNASFSGSNS